MIVEETELKGVVILKPDVYADERGYFFESYNKEKYNKYSIPSEFVQDNISKSKKNTVRGLHYQIGNFAQGKLCHVVYGKVLDVAVDLRNSSPTFGKYTAAELSDENHYQIWIPIGFAHGFAVLSNEAIFHYKCTQIYNKEHERALYYADKNLNINWKVIEPLVSEKDRNAMVFKDIGNNTFI
jgi:dTDP-4-dehydrorhamnose 3,5-epimerase